MFWDGRRIFRGRARLGAVTAAGCPITLRGPWSHLEDQYWQVNLGGGVNGPLVGTTFTRVYGPEEFWWDGTAWNPGPKTITWTVGLETEYEMGADEGTLDVNRYWTTRSTLFLLNNIFRPLAAQYSDVLASLERQNPDGAPFNTGGLVELGSTILPQPREIIDQYLADVLRQSLAVRPDVACWFDYEATGLPVMNARLASLETPLVLPVGQGSGLIMSDYQLTPLDHLRPAGVVVVWEDAITGGFEGFYGLPYFVDRYPADVVRYAPGVLVCTVPTGTSVYGGGLAQAMYESLSVRRTTGTLKIVDPDFSLGLRPGRVIQISGDAILDDAQHWVKSVSWNPSTGMATCSMGYPEHLPLSTRLSLRHWTRYAFFRPGSGAIAADF